MPYGTFEAPILRTDLQRIWNGGRTDLLWKRFQVDFCFMCKFKKLFLYAQIFGWKNANKNMSSMIAITYKLC